MDDSNTKLRAYLQSIPVFPTHNPSRQLSRLTVESGGFSWTLECCHCDYCLFGAEFVWFRVALGCFVLSVGQLGTQGQTQFSPSER